MRVRLGRWLRLAIFLMPLIGCRAERDEVDAAASGEAAASAKVTVFAAASATNVIDEIKAVFEQQTGIVVQASYAGSSTLAQQIINGAAADLFLSANVGWADEVGRNVQVAQRRELLGNRLVVVVPTDSALVLTTAKDLTDESVTYISLADPEAVPAGKYARQALVNLGLWDRLSDRVVAAKDVRQALMYVETGAAEAGVVYATDAAASRRVRVAFTIPEGLTDPIRYPLLLLDRGDQPRAAREFYEFLTSPVATEIFEASGFVTSASGVSPEQPERNSSNPIEPQP